MLLEAKSPVTEGSHYFSPVRWEPVSDPRPETTADLMAKLSQVVFIPDNENLKKVQAAGFKVYTPDEQKKPLFTVSYVVPSRTFRVEVPVLAVENVWNLQRDASGIFEEGKLVPVRYGDLGSLKIIFPPIQNQEGPKIQGIERAIFRGVSNNGGLAVKHTDNITRPFLTTISSTQCVPLKNEASPQEYNPLFTYLHTGGMDEKGYMEGIAVHYDDDSVVLFTQEHDQITQKSQ